MLIQSLGYAGIATRQHADWVAFAGGLLGMEVVETSRSSLALRLDDRRARLLIESEAEAPYVFGWEVADRAALDTVAAELEAARTRVTREPAALAARRHVKELISFADP